MVNSLNWILINRLQIQVYYPMVAQLRGITIGLMDRLMKFDRKVLSGRLRHRVRG